MEKQVSLIGLLLFFTFSLHAIPKVEKINNDWTFHLGDISNAEQPEFDDSNWRHIKIPHDWSIEQAFSRENSNRNAWLPGGIAWYRKVFELSADEASKHVELQFDGIYRHAQVWVNGQHVGVQYDGYTSFYFDISSFIRSGQNTIAVRVDNSVQPNCRWYTGSGIYRNVWLRTTEKLHVENWGTAITTPAITKSEARVKINTTITNRLSPAASFELETILFDANGKQVGNARTSQIFSLKQVNMEVQQEISVYNPQLWSVEAPAMYSAVSIVKYKDQIVDEYKSTFGIREIRFDPKKGFFLNNKNLKLKGVCLHHEAAALGAAVPDEVWERRLSKLKLTGCNAIRTAHNPMSPEFMHLCDRLGFLVMDEFVDKWDDRTFSDPHFHQEWKKNFIGTMRRDRNHPSVIIWSVGNENHPPGSVRQTESLKMYCSLVRSIDATRPVVSGMQRGQDIDPDAKVDGILESTQHMDIIAMNYGEQWVKRIGHRNPGKCFVSTESNSYYGSTETERWSLTERSPWFDVLENDFNIGQFLWVGIEYMGEIPENGKDSWPEMLCWPSAFLNTAGFRTPLSYQFQALWKSEPMVWIGVYEKDKYFNKKWGSPAINSTWNLSRGESYDLVTYSNCEYVELYVNDRRIGKQKLSDFSNWVMNWYDIAFETGEIKAIGMKDGKAVCEHVIKTAGNPVTVALTADNKELRNGEVAHIEVQLLDSKGNMVNHKEKELFFEVKGGEVLALDNGALDALTDMQERKTRSTNLGKCVAIVRAEAGFPELTLEVNGNGLSKAKIALPILLQ